MANNGLTNGQIKKLTSLEKISFKITSSVGTPTSIILHTLVFVGIFALRFLGVEVDQILLLLTTAVSLEAIYLAIFIQMTVNRNTESLEDLEEEVDEISEDIEDIQEEDRKDDAEDRKAKISLKNLEDDIDRLLADIQTLKKDLPKNPAAKKFLSG